MNPSPGTAVALAVLFDHCSGPLARVLSVGSQAIRALCSVLQLLWDVGVTPLFHPPRNPLQEHKARDAQTGFQWCLTSASSGTLSFASWESQQPQGWLSSPHLCCKLHSALPGCCDYRGEVRTCSVCVTSQGQLPVSVSCLDSKPSPQTLSVQQCPALALLGVPWGRAGTCQLLGTSLPHST